MHIQPPDFIIYFNGCCFTIKFKYQNEQSNALSALQILRGVAHTFTPEMLHYAIIPPASTKLEARYTGFTLYVCPSVRLWTESCPPVSNNTHRIHFIFAHFTKQLQKVL